ncbi:uncharacterized protein LOC128201897 [Galleria mellonella]|uniref:Uncharacterized protein LOC128201897 n=1 Tax=Galleria mellonella TaxID=7137 RepID=A0ABM3MY84_GALME|nr:uncharacterized protein LOC128201897 [Galleria mellonella]
MSTSFIDDDFFSCSSKSSSDISYASAFAHDVSISLYAQLTNLMSSNCKNNLNIVHINAQSVPAHYDDLLSAFDSKIVDAVLISESFLKPPLLSTQFSLPGFRLIRNDRVGAGGGGVAIYLRMDISYKIIEQSPSIYSQSAEYLFIEINCHYSKLVLGVYYSPSCHIDYFSSFESNLENLSTLYDHTIILGDFNTCLIKDDHRSHKLRSIISSVNLHLLPLSATHHAPHSSPSLLDLIIVTNPDNVDTFGQTPSPFSYHDLIFVSYKLRMPKRHSKFLFLRNFKGIDLNLLSSDARKIDWSPVLDCPDIDGKVAALNSILIHLYDVHAPLRRIRVKHLPAPWLDETIKTFMAKRDRAKRKYRRSPTEYQLSKMPRPECESFSFSMITECDVKRHLLTISSKATGADGVGTQMLHPIMDELVSIITHIINFSLDTCSFPELWKKAYIIPVPKTSNPSTLTDFRPISILPALSKLLEQIVHKQLSVYLSSNNLLSPLQSGFRPGHSTVSALVKVTDDIRRAMDNHSLTLLVLLVFSSAFNSVDYDILLNILSSLNISPPVINWFNSYLRGRLQCVRHAHVGLRGNEEADRLAKLGIEKGREHQSLPHFTDYISKLKNQCQKDWKEYFNEISKEKGIWYKTIQAEPPHIPWFCGIKINRFT